MTISDYLSKSMKWNATGDAEFPYASTIEGKPARIRLNDFPAENLYTLVVGGSEFSFDDWPKSWVKTLAKKTSKPATSPRGRLAKAI